MQQIGPCQLERYGSGWIAVRCPRAYDRLCEAAGGLWEPALRRIGPVLAQFMADADPLFRWGGLNDECAAGDLVGPCRSGAGRAAGSLERD